MMPNHIPPFFLRLGTILIGLSLLMTAVSFLARKHWFVSLVKYLIGFLLLCTRARFSILTGLFLVLLPVAALQWPGMIRGVFFMHGTGQLAFVTWSTLMVSLMVFVTFRVNCLTANERFGSVAGATIPELKGFILRRLWKRMLTFVFRDPKRFQYFRVALRREWGWGWCGWLLLGLGIPIFCLYTTISESVWNSPNSATGMMQAAIPLGIGLLVGIIAAVISLLCLVVLQRIVFTSTQWHSGLLPFESLRVLKRLPNWGKWLAPRFGALVDRVLGPSRIVPSAGQRYYSNGYIRVVVSQTPHSWHLEQGHAQAGLVWAVLTICHLAYYAIYSGLLTAGLQDIPSENGLLSALFFVMIAIFYLGFTLAEVSFFLDYYRVPTLVPVILILLASYKVWGVDHFYDLNPPQQFLTTSSENAPIPEQIELKLVFGETNSRSKSDQYWKFPRYRHKRTLVVVTAAGGGIQASAWTARVLTGLDKRFKGFSESVGMVSSVSGGTIGSMFYLLYRGDREDSGFGAMRIPSETRDAINNDSMASGMEAAFWGLAVPDLIRIAFPPAVPPDLDRGWALEMEWRRRMMLSLKKLESLRPDELKEQQQIWREFRLLDWVAKIRERKMPIPIFNSTILETGQRIMLSPVTALDPSKPFAQDLLSGVEFFKCYSESTFHPNPSLMTAARLSATFSYVSPVCRPKWDSIPKELRNQKSSDETSFANRIQWHLADGGYSDNEGIVTATKWTQQILEHYRSRRDSDPTAQPPFDRVLLIRINGFPDRVATPEQKTRDVQEKPASGSGFSDVVLGPIMTLSSVRVATQSERGDYEVNLFEQAKVPLRWAEVDSIVEHKTGVNLEYLAAAAISPLYLTPTQLLVNSVNLVDRSFQSEKAESSKRRLQKVTGSPKKAKVTPLKNIEVRSIKFQYPDNVPYPPLSWSLTSLEKQHIDDAWKKIEKELEAPIEGLPPSDKPLGPKHLKAYFSRWDEDEYRNENEKE